jgi:hypothetical protein
LVFLLAIWYFFKPFGISLNRLVILLVILWQFGIFSPVLVPILCQEKSGNPALQTPQLILIN